MPINKATIQIDGVSDCGIEERLLALEKQGGRRVIFAFENSVPLDELRRAISFAHQLKFSLIGLSCDGSIFSGAQRLISFDQVTFFNRKLFELITDCNFFKINIKGQADRTMIKKTLEGIRALNRACQSAQNLDRRFLELKIELSRENQDLVEEEIGAFIREKIDRVELKAEPTKNLEKQLSSIKAIGNKLYLADIWFNLIGLPICLLPGWEEHAAELFLKSRGKLAEKCRACAFKDYCNGLTQENFSVLERDIKPIIASKKLAEIIGLRQEVWA